MNNELVLSLIINTLLTAGAYLCVPVIFGFIRKKRTEKQIKRIIFINGAVVWFIFALIRAENNIQGTGASVFLWSAVAHWFLKAKCLKKEETDTSHTSSRGNYNIMSEDVYLDPSNAIELEKNHPVTAVISPQVIPKTKHYQIYHKCQVEFEEAFPHCPYCGKKIRKTKSKKRIALIQIVLVILICAVSCFGYLYMKMVKHEEIRDKAFTAMYDQKFCEAKYHFDQLPNADEVYPAEYAYTAAGVLMEEEKYLEALRAFKKLSYPVPDSLLNELKQCIYEKGQEYYRSNKNGNAQTHFNAIKGYRQSDDYLTLIKADHFLASYDELVKLIDFEDTKVIITNSSYYTERFLTGSWRSLYGNHYFKLDGKGNLNTNLPKTSWGNSFKLNNGIISIGSNDNYKENYKISIVGENMIVLFCYKDNQSYSLMKE